MNPKKQHLLDTVTVNIPTNLVTGWRPSFGNSVRGEIAGLPKHLQATVIVQCEKNGTFCSYAGGAPPAVDGRTPEETVLLAIRQWARSQPFDCLPKTVRELPGVKEDALEKSRGEIRVKVADKTHRLRYLIRERDGLTVQIDRLNKEIEQLQEQFMAMETR